MSQWVVVTTGYLNANGYKRGKDQLTSQIESRCQYGQRGQKSCTTSTLTLRNGEAVTHHFIYDREGEKQMGSASASYQTEKTKKIQVQALAEEEGQYTRLMPRLQLDDPMAYQNFIWMPPQLFQELEQ